MQLEDAQGELADAKEDKPEAGDEEDVEMEVDATEGSGGSKKEEKTETKEGKEKDDDDLREYNLDDYDEPTAEEKLTGQCEWLPRDCGWRRVLTGRSYGHVWKHQGAGLP